MSRTDYVISAGILEEVLFLGISVITGAGLFFFYDLFRVFRRIVPHGEFWIAVEDFLYWLICAVTVFVVLYRNNDGMIRGFALGGVVLGMVLYLVVLSRLVIGVQVWIWHRILAFFAPVTIFCRKILHFLRKRLKKMKKVIKMGLCKR